MMKRVTFVVLVGCTLGVWSPRTDHDVAVAQQRGRIVVTRIFTGPDRQTHTEENNVKLAPGGGSTELSEMAEATGAQFRRQAPNYFEDRHPLGPGHILLVEDLTGKGHISRGVGTEDRISLLIPLDE